MKNIRIGLALLMALLFAVSANAQKAWNSMSSAQFNALLKAIGSENLAQTSITAITDESSMSDPDEGVATTITKKDPDIVVNGKTSSVGIATLNATLNNPASNMMRTITLQRFDSETGGWSKYSDGTFKAGKYRFSVQYTSILGVKTSSNKISNVVGLMIPKTVAVTFNDESLTLLSVAYELKDSTVSLSLVRSQAVFLSEEFTVGDEVLIFRRAETGTTISNITDVAFAGDVVGATVGLDEGYKNLTVTAKTCNVMYQVNPVTGKRTAMCASQNVGAVSAEVTQSGSTYKFTVPAGAKGVLLSASATPIDYTVTNSVNDSSRGTVAIEGVNSSSVAHVGDNVVLTPTPVDARYVVSSVKLIKGTDTTSLTAGEDGKYAFTMPASNVTVKTKFDQVAWELVVDAESARGSVQTNLAYVKANDVVEFSIVPSEGFEVYSVTVTQTNLAGANAVDFDKNDDYSDCSFTVPSNGDVKIAVLFKAKTYTALKIEPKNGKFDLYETDLSTSKEIDSESAINITYGHAIVGYAKANDGYTVGNMIIRNVDGDDSAIVSKTDTAQGYDAAFLTVVPVYNATYEMEFIPIDYKIEKGSETYGEINSISAEVAHVGDTINVSVTPDVGYAVGKTEGVWWTSGGAAAGGNAEVNDDGTYSFVMPAEGDIWVNLKCELINYPIRVSAEHADAKAYENNNHGELTTATFGQTVAFGAKADEGYKIDALAVVAKSTSSVVNQQPVQSQILLDYLSDAGYKAERAMAFSMPADSVTLLVTTSPIDYIVKTMVLESSKGSVSASSTSAHIGDVVTFTATPADGFALDKIVVTPEGGEAETLVCEENACSYEMPAKNVTAVATFRDSEKYTITFKFGDKKETAEVEKGFKPKAPESFKCSENTAEYTYTCAWDKEFVAVTEAATYTYSESKVKNSYVIKVAVNDTKMGSVTGLSETGKYEYGTEVKIKATAKTGYVFTNWNDDVKTAERTIKVTGDKTYTASFKAEASSSSSKKEEAKSSSSVKTDDSKSSSSSAKAKSSSSSAKAKSSSSSAKAKSSSSSAKAKFSSSSAKAKSSSSKGKDAIVARALVPQFSVTTVARDVQIASAKVGAPFAILDMQGRVMTSGRVESANFNLTVSRAGTFMIRIGSETQVVNVK